MSGTLTTHILDTSRGGPAAGVEIALFRLSDSERVLVATAVTNSDGRTDVPLLPTHDFMIGTYELVFKTGPYLRSHALNEQEGLLFLDEIPIRFSMGKEEHYHVPLLLSPYGYSTYRGS